MAKKSSKKVTTELEVADYKTRNYACVVYPDSAPENWLEIIGELAIPCLVSPCHDLDVNPDGTLKKPHYHVLFMFDNVKTKKQFEMVKARFGGVGSEYVQSPRGYSRYLCHLDNPEKYQYDVEKVRQFGGADFCTLINLVTDKYKAIEEMIQFIDYNKIYSYRALLRYCSENRKDWFRVLCDNGTMVILEYLKSSVWEDKENGEYKSKRVHFLTETTEEIGV